MKPVIMHSIIECISIVRTNVFNHAACYIKVPYVVVLAIKPIDAFESSSWIVSDYHVMVGKDTFYMMEFTNGIVTGGLSKRYAQAKLRLFYLF